jgi:hypothetical protein
MKINQILLMLVMTIAPQAQVSATGQTMPVTAPDRSINTTNISGINGYYSEPQEKPKTSSKTVNISGRHMKPQEKPKTSRKTVTTSGRHRNEQSPVYTVQIYGTLKKQVPGLDAISKNQLLSALNNGWLLPVPRRWQLSVSSKNPENRVAIRGKVVATKQYWQQQIAAERTVTKQTSPNKSNISLTDPEKAFLTWLHNLSLNDLAMILDKAKLGSTQQLDFWVDLLLARKAVWKETGAPHYNFNSIQTLQQTIETTLVEAECTITTENIIKAILTRNAQEKRELADQLKLRNGVDHHRVVPEAVLEALKEYIKDKELTFESGPKLMPNVVTKILNAINLWPHSLAYVNPWAANIHLG